jgi:hypothetical protein
LGHDFGHNNDIIINGIILMRRSVLISSILFFLVLFGPLAGFAGMKYVIHLKNGRTIEADEVWHEGDKVFYVKMGGKIGISRFLVNKIDKIPVEDPKKGSSIIGDTKIPILDKIFNNYGGENNNIGKNESGNGGAPAGEMTLDQSEDFMASLKQKVFRKILIFGGGLIGGILLLSGFAYLIAYLFDRRKKKKMNIQTHAGIHQSWTDSPPEV